MKPNGLQHFALANLRVRVVTTGFIVAVCLVSMTTANVATAAGASPTTSRSFVSRDDSLYNAHHPRLLFTLEELLPLRQKVRDGGRDDTAYGAIFQIVKSVYPTRPEEELFEDTFGVNIMPNLGLVAHIETPVDREALEFGRHMTLYILDNDDPDDNVFYSSLRMRAISYGYDMFFDDAPESLRTSVRDEIVAYVDTTMSVFRYQRWLHSPYVSNYSAVIGSALGIAALCLEHEMPAEWVEAAIGRADAYVEAWRAAHLDPDGSYSEGPMYAGWSMRNLAYYFWARARLHDRYDYSTLAGIRNLEKWIAFSLLPVGGAAVNNVNDSAYLNYALSRHHTYLDWAQTAWGSGVSAWLWERILGPEYGHDSGILADHPATVLWHRDLTPVNPRDRFSLHAFWRRQGLYYFRTGWPDGDASDDVLFSFHSGKFMGGHAHEDQNNFTLWGYGAAFVTDNGYGIPAKDTEGHNLVLIDGRGQHHAGGSIGTDGLVREQILSSFADYVFGDATAAYTTHSEFNRRGYPFPDDDWSWGYDGGNPVEFAYRRVIVVHGGPSPPYFVVADDIRKDGFPHVYSWRLHTREDNTVDLSANPIRIRGDRGLMDLFVLSPPFDSLAVAQEPFDNGEVDPNTTVVSLTYEGTDFSLCSILLPGENPPQHAVVRHVFFPQGAGAIFGWPEGITDVVLSNPSGNEISFALEDAAGSDGPSRITTDARMALIRLRGNDVAGLFASGVSRFDYRDLSYVRIYDGTLDLVFAADTVHVDRSDADFSFYLPRGGEVRYEHSVIPCFNDAGFAIPDRSESPASLGALRLRAFPNPFQSITNVVVDLGAAADVTVAIYDIGGRLVARLWEGQLPRGANLLKWSGTETNGKPLATGIYFVRADTPTACYTIKIARLK